MPPTTALKGPFWVIWKDVPDANQARASAQILGGTNNPPHVAGFFQAGPFSTYADAQAYEAKIGTGAVIPTPGTPIVGSAGKGLIPNFAQPIEDIGNFFHSLTQTSTWVRVGEVALGGILVYVGVRALSQGSSVAGAQARKPITRGVKKVATGAASVAVPEARLATRTVAKKVAPKTTKRVAAHREQVRKYGAKKPYQAPPKRQPIVHKVERTSTIIHKKA